MIEKFDTVSRNISTISTESYGIIDKEINPEKYIVGAGDRIYDCLSSVINKLNSGKIRIRVLPDGYLFNRWRRGIYIAGKKFN